MKTKSRNSLITSLTMIVMMLAILFSVVAISPLTAYAAERADREIVAVDSGNSLNMSINNQGLLTWDTVTGATGYGISVNQNGVNIANFDTTNPFIVLMTEMDNLKIDSGLYTIEVYAKGVSKRASMTYYYTSNVDKLEAPHNLQWVGNQACWDAVDGADSYKLYLYSFTGQEFTTTTTNCLYDLSAYNPADGWTFKVQSQSNGTLNAKRNSALVESPAKGSRTRTLNAVNSGNSLNMVATNEGLLTWNAVDNATGYRVAVKQNGIEITYFETTNNLIALTSSLDGAKLASGQYTIEVEPQGVVANSASMLYYYTSHVDQLEAPYNLHWNGTQACWTAVNGATLYDVTLCDFNGAVFTVATEEDYYDFSGNAPQDGWTFKVQARSNGTLNAPRHSIPQESPAKETTYSIYCVVPENGTVSLTTNKGSREDVTSAVLSATNGSEVTVSAVANPGYEFVAWRLNIPSDPAATCSTDATYTFDAMSEIHIFAVFTNEYTVTYNGNGGAGAEMQGSVVNVNNERNQTFTLGECTYTAPYGKEFKGWAVGSVDAFPLNEAGDIIEIHADTTIYAIWDNRYIIVEQPENTSGKIGANVPVTVTIDISQVPNDSNEYIVLKVKNGDNWEQVSAMTRSSWVDSFHSSTGSFNVTSNTTGTKTYRYEVYDGTEWKISDTFDVEFLPLVVTFVDNEHSTVTEPINVYEYNTLITEPVIPTFAGDTFYGWGWPNWDFANDRVTQDITLSAQWAGRGYYGNIPDVYALVNAKARIDLSNVYSNNSYTYVYKYDGANWNQVENVTNYGYYDIPASDVAKIETYKIVIKHSKDIESNEFIVTWTDTLPTYTVIYGVGEGQGSGDADYDIEYGTNYTLNSYEKIGMVAPYGKEFDYWSIRTGSAMGAEIAQKQADETITVTADTYVIAMWKNAPTVTVSYYSGGNVIDSDTVAVGTQHTLMNTQGLEVPSGKKFKAWAIGGLGGVQKQPGDEITITEETCIYAVWEDNEVIYSYCTNGAEGSNDTNYATVGEEITLADCMFTAPEGKQFKAWAIGSVNGEQKQPGDKITITEETYIYAIWEDTPVVKYDVTFNANGGTGTMSPVEYAGTYTLPACGFTAPDGKKFKGWATTANGEVIDGTTYNVTADVELYAIWEDIPVPTSLTATYTGTILAGTTINPSGISITLNYSDSSTEPVSAGNVEYWYNGQQITNPVAYVFGVELIGNLNITIKYEGLETTMAVQIVGHAITFNANGGTGEMTATEYVGAYTLPANGFTAPTGQQFKGWALTNNGEIITTATYNVTEPITLYAIWEDIPHNHDYGTTWESDANNHWNECSCGDKANVGAHSDGNADGKCDTCDSQMTNGGGNTETPDKPKDGLSGGAIAGIVVGSVAVAGLGGFALVWFVIKKKSFADLIAIFKKK